MHVGELMKKIFFAIVLSGIILIQNIYAANVTFRYHILLNQRKQGLMSLKVSGNTFQCQYFNVSQNDRIPFYFSKKAGKFDSNMFSEEISFHTQTYDIYKKAKDIPSEYSVQTMIRRRDDKAVMIDRKTQLPKIVFDQIPLVCFENILIGLYTQKFSEKQPLFLYEEGSKSQFIIYYERKGQQNIQLNNKTVQAEKLIFKRQNVPGQPGKPVFELNMCKSVPVRVSSLSRRWELNLYKMGNEIQQTYDRTGKFKNIARVKIKNHHNLSSHGIDILSHSFNQNTFSFKYKNVYKLAAFDKSKLVKEFIKNKYSQQSNSYRSRNSFHDKLNIKQMKSGYVVTISNKNICSELSKIPGYRIKNDKYLTQTITHKVSKTEFKFEISDKFENVHCKNFADEDLPDQYELAFKESGKKLNCKKAAKYYIKQTGKYKNSGDFIDAHCTTGFSDYLCGDVRLTFQKKDRIDFSTPENKKYAAKYLANTLGSESSFNITKLSNRLVFNKKGYELHIPMSEIAKYRNEKINRLCQSAQQKYTDARFTIEKNTPNYNAFQCTLYGKSEIPLSMVGYEDTIFIKHPELRFFKNTIQTKGANWIFPTIPEIKNLCQ